MKITIKIENCETISDFYSHLTELRLQIKKEAKKLKLDPLRDAFTKASEHNLNDANCYGEHYVSINPKG